MIRFKEKVSLAGMQPETGLAIVVADQVCSAHHTDFVVTSVTDGRHSKGSKHYIGHAFDMRSRHMDDALKKLVVQSLRDRLGGSYDVVSESTHIHIEFDPDLANV